MPATKNWDRFIMLLSADWFFDMWDLIGLEVGPQVKRLVQSAARQSVQELMGGATIYWNISFSDTRIARTQAGFLDRLRSSRLKPSDLDSVISTADNLLVEQGDDDTQKTLFLFHTLTADLLQHPNSVPPRLGLSGADIQLIRDAFEKASTAPSGNEFERLLISSDTSWDKYLRDLTPNIPTSLSDWIASIITIGNTFKAYWSNVRDRLNRTSLDTLIKWYDAAGRRRAGHEVQLKIPEWMTVRA